MAVAKYFQKKGADKQKNTVRDKVRNAIKTLREAQKAISPEHRTEILFEDVVRESTVSSRTLDKSYHAPLVTEIERFLADVNVGVAIVAKPKPRAPARSTIFQQNKELMQRVEALRWKLRTELAEKDRELQAMTARFKQLNDEAANLRSSRRGGRSTPPKSATRRRDAA
jgi:hypothetical protein